MAGWIADPNNHIQVWPNFFFRRRPRRCGLVERGPSGGPGGPSLCLPVMCGTASLSYLGGQKRMLPPKPRPITHLRPQSYFTPVPFCQILDRMSLLTSGHNRTCPPHQLSPLSSTKIVCQSSSQNRTLLSRLISDRHWLKSYAERPPEA